jgi:phage terminase large subunit GpA-like protein
VLLAGIDTQDAGWWYEIRAFARGPLLESWQIREGFVPADWAVVPRDALEGRPWRYHPVFDALREILFETEYADANGETYPVRMAVIDAMGHHATAVYDFCRGHRGRISPLQGMPGRSNTRRKWSKLDTYPGGNKPIPGGVQLFQVDVNAIKDDLSSKLQISAMDPGAWHFHAETSRDWARQMCAEYLDEKTNRWTCPGHKDNHAWDCSVYALALAEELGLNNKPVQMQANPRERVRNQRQRREENYLW